MANGKKANFQKIQLKMDTGQTAKQPTYKKLTSREMLSRISPAQLKDKSLFKQ